MISMTKIQEINETYFNACNFASLMCGVHFAVLITALHKIYTGPGRATQLYRWMTVPLVLFFLMSVIHLGAFWAYVRQAFIAHGETSESTAHALNSYPVWFLGITSVSDANAVVADCLIIWRCWVIWGRSWKVILIPVICTMLTAVFSAIAIHKMTTATSFLNVEADFATALYSTSLVATAYCTGTIAFRIVRIGVLPRASHGLQSYRATIEIVVESSVMYCIATLFAMISYLSDGPASVFAYIFWTSITGIAPTLLVARVAAGEARPDRAWNDFNDPRQGPTSSFLSSGSDSGVVNHNMSNFLPHISDA